MKTMKAKLHLQFAWYLVAVGVWWWSWAACSAQVDSTPEKTPPQGARQHSDLIAEVSQLLIAKCLTCHSGAEPAGDVDLLRPDLVVRAAGETAGVDESLFAEVVREGLMPPEESLSPAELQVIERWLAAGAPWNQRPIDPFEYSSSARAGRDWWALQPLQPREPPSVQSPQLRTPVDAFLLEKLRERQLEFSPPAAPRELIRRLYFDLIGLPPPAEVVEAFVADPSDAHYERQVDQLLQRPEFGERWARHWLDLVRFGESDGFERNAPRNDAWHYRDWVINAINQDLPFDRFVQYQIAGDQLLDDPIAARAAQGYLVAGVHNTVVGVSPTMQLLARQDELEDLIGSVGQTFLGLTLNCARCHDHKFDPITQREYYEFAACLSGVNHGLSELPVPGQAEQLAAWQTQASQLQAKLVELEQPFQSRWRSQQNVAGQAALERVAGVDADVWEVDFTRLAAGGLESLTGWQWHGDVRLSTSGLELSGQNTYGQSPALPWDLHEKTLEVWLQVADLEQSGGGVVSIETPGGERFDALVFAEQEPHRWMAGSEFFQRTRSWQGEPENADGSQWIHLAITYAADGTIAAYRNGQLYGTPYRAAAPVSFAAGKAHVLVGLRHSPPSGNKFWRGTVGRLQIHRRALNAVEISQRAANGWFSIPEETLQQWMSAAQWTQRQSWRTELQEIVQRIASERQRAPVKIYTQQSQPPHAVNFLPRGDVTRPGEVVEPDVLDVLQRQIPWVVERGELSDGQRRLQLARWITNPQQALFQRVAVNRLWQYHFGTGLVPTPSDFGFQGGRPSHPELLDWLAGQLPAHDYRLKPIHKMLVMSAAYRQSSRMHERANQLDSDNRLLWRRSPIRLDAETIRDSMLVVAGVMNPTAGGPGYLDVKIIDEGNGTTYYEPLDRDDPALNRRTIYRFTPRGGRSALLDVFDCPDPAAATPLRTVTTTPLQALSLLNNAFVLRMSEHFAKRALAHAPGPQDQVRFMFLTALAREPDSEELSQACQLLESHGPAALARALFNSSEFVVAR